MKANKVLYVSVGLLLLFILVTVMGNIAEGEAPNTIRLSIEWLTKYVLPWIFLYWFIKLVRKIK
ncbi:hypothetical protein [Paenibacillus solani]|uniref:Uncharacterized protein n=1 Tax=Paenibacillus solani TaxID=1705565 RepID=A0A0M1N2J4_9BACL|nr:hypothetical protein [Paenibacillus solani]KOR76348.1 hypothetical protein AM231_27445 [Paenibacillus solani]